MHNFRIYHHKIEDNSRINLQKEWDQLVHFSNCYGFLKLEKNLKSNEAWHGQLGGKSGNENLFKKALLPGIEPGSNLK